MIYKDKIFNQLVNDSDITAYLNLIKLHDEEAYNHCLAVGELTCRFMEKVTDKYSAHDCHEIIKGALIHDIGKIYLPFGLIQSTKALDYHERKVIEEHPLLGYVSIKDTALSDIIKKIVLKHHCQMNGNSYPTNEIIEETEQYVWIINMIDKFNAMTSVRPFKEPLSWPDAYKEIVKMAKKDILPYQNLLTFKEVIREAQL